MTRATLIEAVINAPAERQEAILAAASGKSKPRPGTIKEAADVLGVCPRTVERYVRQGLLRQIRISKRKIRYDLNEVDRLAERGAEAVLPK